MGGLEKKPNFYQFAIEETGRLDEEAVKEEVVDTATELMTRDPDIRAILLECSLLPPYALAVQEAVNLPVFDYGGLIVMGGTMSVNDFAKFPFLVDEIDLINKWLETGKPLLGICLGAQLMAKALGENVQVGKKPEIGWVKIHFTKDGASDMIFRHVAPEITVFEWHYDTFDLPQGTDRLAYSALYQNQAFRLGKNAYALQFHPEVDEDLIHDWIEMHREKLKKMNPDLLQKILTDNRLYLRDFEKMGRHIIKSLCLEVD